MNESILAKNILLDRNCDNCGRADTGTIECFRKIEGKWRWYSISKNHICEQWKKYEGLHYYK